MKFSDFPKEHVIVNVYDALDELYLDYPLKVYPYFFDRLRAALEYLDISSESIKDLNSDNQENYLGAVYDLLKEVTHRYNSIIKTVQDDENLVLKYYTMNLLGFDRISNNEPIEIMNILRYKLLNR